MSARLAGKIAIVTGGGSGVGAAVSRRFAQEGAKVVVADRDLDKAREVAEGLSAAGMNAVACGCDVADGATVKALVEFTQSHFGTPDIVVNNAGVPQLYTIAHESDEQEYDRMFDVNAKSLYWCAAMPFQP